MYTVWVTHGIFINCRYQCSSIYVSIARQWQISQKFQGLTYLKLFLLQTWLAHFQICGSTHLLYGDRSKLTDSIRTSSPIYAGANIIISNRNISSHKVLSNSQVSGYSQFSINCAWFYFDLCISDYCNKARGFICSKKSNPHWTIILIRCTFIRNQYFEIPFETTI